jgi:hypothetical protein
MLDKITRQDFAQYLHQTFYIHAPSLAPIAAELIEVSELSTPPSDRRAPFSIVFRTQQRDQYLIQAIYQVEHAEMGTLDLFLVPLGPDAEGMRYEAVFA